jgi:uncharacterized membrane protein YraQ (UPF0718 family)
MMREARSRFPVAVRTTWRTFLGTAPVVLGVLLLTGLASALVEARLPARFLGTGDFVGTSVAALAGSIAAGHPVTSYVIAGEALRGGVGLVAATALIVSWVTVGVIQLPAEAASLGRRFALLRNALAFVSAIAIAYLTSFTLAALGS